MAQQLVAAENEVAELIVLDTGFIGDRTYLDETFDTPPSAPPAISRFLAAWDNALPRVVVRWLHRLERVWDRPGRIIEKLTHEYQLLTSAQHRRFQQVREHHGEIAHQYRPTPYPGPITLIFSEESASDPARAWYAPSWELLAEEGTTLHVVPGRHETIMREPHVQSVAAQLQRYLDEIHSRDEVHSHEVL
jgi:thioesterase domain-containing protein